MNKDQIKDLEISERADLLTFPPEPARKSHKKKIFIIFLTIILLSLIAAGVFFYLKIHTSFSSSPPLSEEVLLEPLIRFPLNEINFFTEWKEHVFHGRTTYKIEQEADGSKILHASSQGSSSFLYKEMNVPISNRPVLSWKWKAIQFPSNKENKVLASKSDNDFAVRVYVGFKGKTPFTPDVIQYVWDDYFPEGTSAESPFLKGTKVFVVQSGKPIATKEWVFEKRDLIRDYEMLFGKKPKGNIGAIGVMSDSDNTGTFSEAYIRDILIERPVGIKAEQAAAGGFKIPILGDFAGKTINAISAQTENLKRQSQKLFSSFFKFDAK